MQTLVGKFQRFFSPILENKMITFLYIIYFIIETSFGVLFIFFVRDIILVFEVGEQAELMGVIQAYLIYFVGLTILMMLMYDKWTLSYNRYRSSIENKYLPKYIQLDSNTLDSIGTGKIIAIISGGVNTWGGLIDKSLIQLTQIAVSIGVSTYFLLQIQNGLVLLLFALLIIGQVLGYIVNVKLVGIRKNRIELANRWSKHMVKIIMSKMEILQSDKIKDEVQALKDNHEGQIYYNKKMAVFLVPFFMIGNVIVMILLCVSFYYFSELYFRGRIGLSDIAALSGALMLLQKEFINSLDFVKNFGKEFAQVQNIWDFFDTTPAIQGYDTGNVFSLSKGEVSFKDVTYGYDTAQSVFQNFDLDLAGGKITALVGPSGGGKTTLVKLIAGYIRPNKGEVLIDSEKLSETSLKSYFTEIGYLTQEPNVFDGTIRENLGYAIKGEVSEQEIEQALNNAQCQFVFEFDKGIDTEIGEKGIRLSGGQRQRLAIAKIFLKNPHIIILDEPTSALDSFSEAKIAQAMENLFKGRTVIVIAHRLQTVKHADDIIYIKDGEIIERGNHQELVKQGGLYKQMLDLQSGF